MKRDVGVYILWNPSLARAITRIEDWEGLVTPIYAFGVTSFPRIPGEGLTVYCFP